MEVLGDLHVGVKRTKSSARMHCWFPTLDAEIDRMVGSCERCQKTRPQAPKAKSDTWPEAGPWERLPIDYAEIDGQTFCVLVDAGTGWIDVEWTSGPHLSEAA